MGQRLQPARTHGNCGTFFTLLAASAASFLLHGCGGGGRPKAQQPPDAARASRDAWDTNKRREKNTSGMAPRVSALRTPVERRGDAGGVNLEHVSASGAKADLSKVGVGASWYWKDKEDKETTTTPVTTTPVTTTPAPTPAPTSAPPAYCSDAQTDCRATKCCIDPNMRCYSKNNWWAECLNKSSCEPGIHAEDPVKYRSNWSCTELSGPTQPPFHGWNYGTWTTGYWDCCKPSCAWPRKGNQSRPVRSCHARTGKWLHNASEISVCSGGVAASCTSHHPFMVNDGLSMGFAAAAVRGGAHHLTGDTNCGQCYELVFTDEQHPGPNNSWGGAGEDLVDKRMIVQITNIGDDVDGNQTFDIQIPGAGLGMQTTGCTAQFPGTKKDDFDCGKRYGGCDSIKGCNKLPKDLQTGCRWRYTWYHWLKKGGRTNNPYVKFRRVKCPLQLTAISGSVPNDEDGWLIVM
mmetsp:Transcript_124940/g.249466  ORF Transcript_124940/g.249466 Transcript_124940/m.249466 type:complete len:462 (-) Transcript_124940:295-1680(-)